MSEQTATTAAIFALAASIAAAAATASFTYFSTARSDREKALTEQRKEAYVGYVSALDKDRVSRMDFKCDLEKDKLCQQRLEFEVQGGAALRRIGIYGDPAVVHATAEYSRAIGSLTTPCDSKHWKLDLNMYLEMRRSVLGEQGAIERDLAELLLPCKTP